MKKLIYLTIITLLGFLNLKSQNDIHAGEMNFQNTIANDSILIEISAPTTGWLAVGFNIENKIVGSDLKMFKVNNGQIEAEDQFVKGIQDHPGDASIGGENNIKLLSGIEDAKGTRIKFKIPLHSNDRFDYSHKMKVDFWLILAYSESDDFEHHSIMRKHFQINWSEEQGIK